MDEDISEVSRGMSQNFNSIYLIIGANYGDCRYYNLP